MGKRSKGYIKSVNKSAKVASKSVAALENSFTDLCEYAVHLKSAKEGEKSEIAFQVIGAVNNVFNKLDDALNDCESFEYALCVLNSFFYVKQEELTRFRSKRVIGSLIRAGKRLLTDHTDKINSYSKRGRRFVILKNYFILAKGQLGEGLGMLGMGNIKLKESIEEKINSHTLAVRKKVELVVRPLNNILIKLAIFRPFCISTEIRLVLG